MAEEPTMVPSTMAMIIGGPIQHQGIPETWEGYDLHHRFPVVKGYPEIPLEEVLEVIQKLHIEGRVQSP